MIGMKNVLKYVPAVFLAAGLVFNVGYKKEVEAKQSIEYIVNQHDSRTIDGKTYFLENFNSEVFPNKELIVYSKVKPSDSKEFNATYTCYTDVEGNFHKDVLHLRRFQKDISSLFILTVYANRTSSGLEIERAVCRDANELKIIGKKLALEKLNLFNKLFDIEERINKSKGENLYHLIDELDITKLTVEDFKRHNDVLFSDGHPSVFVSPNTSDPNRPYGTSILVSKGNICMIVDDYGNDGIVDSVYLRSDCNQIFGTTKFVRENNTYKYIKGLYSKEEVKNIFEDAEGKLNFVKGIKEGVK